MRCYAPIALHFSARENCIQGGMFLRGSSMVILFSAVGQIGVQARSAYQ